MVDVSRRYKMDNPERGLALIINNVNFENREPRKGSNVDAAALEKSFRALGFNVHTRADLRALDMTILLKQVAGLDHSDRDCFACIILSHGDKDVVIGTDGFPVTITDIIDPFKDSKSLLSKPKLFFIEACRGKAEDAGAQPDSLGYGRQSGSSFTIPAEADILIHYATVQGYVAWRGEETGSWFIQALSNQLDECGKTMELLQLLTRVNGDVAFNKETSTGKKEMPHIASQLTKELYFRPKS